MTFKKFMPLWKPLKKIYLIRHCSVVFIFVLTLFLVLANSALAGNYSSPVNDKLVSAWGFFYDGKYSCAKYTFTEALKLEPNCPDALNGLGLSFLREGNLDQAINRFKAALAINPNFYDALYNLGSSYYQQEKYPQAISYFLRALAIEHKKDPDLLCSIANVYRDQAKASSTIDERKIHWEQANKYYKIALMLNPDLPSAHAFLGKMLIDQHKYEEASQELLIAVHLNKTYPYGFYELGVANYYLEQKPAALLSFIRSYQYEKSKEYKQQTVKIIEEIGVPLSACEHFGPALESIAQEQWSNSQIELVAALSQETPMQLIYLNNLAYVQAKQGNLKEAINLCKQAIQKANGKFPQAQYNLGRLYFSCGDLTKALESFKQAVASSKGTNYLAFNGLAQVYSAQNDFPKAYQHYQLAILHAGSNIQMGDTSGKIPPVLYLNTAVAAEKSALKNKAVEMYKHYLELAPTGINANFAKEHLSKLN